MTPPDAPGQHVLLFNADLSPGARLCYLALRDYEHRGVRPTISQVAAELGVEQATVRRWLRQLTRAGWIHWRAHASHGLEITIVDRKGVT